MSKAVKVLQKMLVDAGENISIDGDLGPQTKNAIDRLNVPDYLKIAMKEVGVLEVPGSGNNPQIIAYHAVSGGFSQDSIPWCASYVNWVMKKDNHKTVKYSARAKSWLKFGIGIDEPIVGAIAVKSRSGGGHVGFVVSINKEKGKLYLLGGNQNDEVNIKKYNIATFMDFRIPKNYGEYYADLQIVADGGASEA